MGYQSTRRHGFLSANPEKAVTSEQVIMPANGQELQWPTYPSSNQEVIQSSVRGWKPGSQESDQWAGWVTELGHHPAGLQGPRSPVPESPDCGLGHSELCHCCLTLLPVLLLTNSLSYSQAMGSLCNLRFVLSNSAVPTDNLSNLPQP